MKPCRRCARHVRRADSQCPFCGAQQSCSPVLAWAFVLGSLGATACGPAVADEPGVDSGSSSSSTAADPTSTSAGPTTTTVSTSPTDDGSSGALESSGDADDSTGSMTTAAYGGPAPDGGGVAIECDVWIQDCPPEEKCMPWANDGLTVWNATRCSPLHPDPRQPGEPCTVEGSGVSGIDDCASSAMCWDVDMATNEGVCVGFCEGTAAAPSCGDPSTGCMVGNDGVLILCLPLCGTELPECAEGEHCVPLGDEQSFCFPN